MDILDLNKAQAVQQNEQETENKEQESKEPVVLEDLSALAWLELEEFSRLSGLPKERILELVNIGKIKSKISHNKLLIDASSWDKRSNQKGRKQFDFYGHERAFFRACVCGKDH